MSLLDTQAINAFRRGGCLTTKAGICRTMREVQHFDTENPDAIFPRCFVLASEPDRVEFVEHFRCGFGSMRHRATGILLAYNGQLNPVLTARYPLPNPGL